MATRQEQTINKLESQPRDQRRGQLFGPVTAFCLPPSASEPLVGGIRLERMTFCL